MNSKIYVVGIGDNLIKRTADILIKGQEDTDLSRIGVVFPGIRPGIYLLKFLTEIYKQPYIPPVRFSIESFIEYAARKEAPECYPIDIIDADYRLYNIVKGLKENYINRYTDNTERWDMFFLWGIKLAGVIDEMDIAQITEEKLKEVELLESLDESIIPYVKHLWTSMSSIRNTYHNIMKEKGFTTRGMDYQYAVELVKGKAKDAFTSFDRFYFVGFNALNKSEDFIIRTLWEMGKAEIIWQSNIDEIYNAKEGTPYYFHRKIWESWGMPELVSISSSLTQNYEKYHFYEGFNTHSQVKKVKEILNEDKKYENTAIVLPNENALIPVIEEVVLSDNRKFNITMGYPLTRTPIYTLFEFIFRAQENREKDTGLYYFRDYLSIMKHPYIKSMYPEEKNTARKLGESINYMNMVFIDINSMLEDKDIRKDFEPEEIEKIEYLHNLLFKGFQSINTLNSLADAIEEVLKKIYKNTPAKEYNPAKEYFASMIGILDNLRSLEISRQTFEKRLLFNIMRGYVETNNVHFTGEPLQGIQILGMLETRGLRFDRVILMDVNEGIVPGIYKYDPILPIGLRKILGLSDYKDRESLYAYNFFRLVQGASDVHIIYNTGEDWNGKNIRSRFVEQLIWEIEKKNGVNPDENKEIVSFNLKIPQPAVISIEKTGEILETLKAMRFSASRLDTYINCPLKFYYQYVLGLLELEEFEETPEWAGIGQIVHTTLQRFFSEYKEKALVIGQGADNNMLHILKETIEEYYNKIEQNGNLLLLYEVAKYRLKNFLREERKRAEESPIQILELEQSYGYKGGKPGIEFNTGASNNVIIGGIIDRVDKISDEYLIIDYKTGSKVEYPSIKDALTEEISSPRKFMKKYIKSIQLPIYILLYSNLGKDIDYQYMDAGLYTIQDTKLRTLFNDNEEHKTEFMEKFIEVLILLFKEMFNPDIPFEPDAEDNKQCGFCPFSSMCKK